MNKPDQADVDRPFPGLPVCRRYVGIGPIEEARLRICRMIERGEALAVLIGPPGTGKSLLCQKIASLYRHSHAVVSLGDVRVSSRLGLIQQVLFHLGRPHQGTDEESLHLSLVQSLTKTAGGPRPLLLIIDEAQMLSADLLDEVRMMTNLVRDGRPLVQTVLVGGPRLEDTLVDPQLESLTQRIAARCYLHPLTYSETEQYIRTAMSGMSLLIDDNAIGSVHHGSGGIPRLINQLMDQAIEIARTNRKSRLDDACVQIAWAELQQLPSPVLEAELRPHTSPIEFGELDSDSECFDFENEATPTTLTIPAGGMGLSDEEPLSYADIAAVLESTSIDCMSPSLNQSHCSGEGRRCDIRMTPAPDDLFGCDFDDETRLEIAPRQLTPRALDPAEEEMSLHEEIRQLSIAANSLYGDMSAEEGEMELPGLSAVIDHAMLPGPRACDIPEELACPLAVVWSDEDVPAPEGDDRDILVIEDDVTMMIDSPSPQSGFIASGAMRKPPQNIEENYQNLFSRLRGGQ
jgi:type II secretory pathway predicted ATPase ExeA